MAFEEGLPETNSEGKAGGYSEEILQQRKLKQEVYGWHILASKIAIFTNTSFDAIMDKEAAEVFGLFLIIKAYNEIHNNNGKL